MRKALLVIALLCAWPLAIVAQHPMAARTNVIPYYDEASIEKNAYRESPYYQELAGSWRQRQTDTSIIYTRQINAEKNWKDYQVFLNVRCGRAARVLLNGKEVGYGADSRHWNEFLLSGFLKYGKSNELSIEAMRYCKESLLEDTALQVGLNGIPYLVFKSDPNVMDLTIQADYDAATASGTLSLSTIIYCGKRKGKYYVEAEIWTPQGREFDRMGRWVVFSGKSEEQVDLVRNWSGVEPWSAESPSLYTLVVRLRNDKMEEEETLGHRFGFRSVSVKDGELLFNGKAITIKGVTYGIEHTEGLSSRQQMKRDVLAMKRCNINAVRTSRFSPMDPYFYELCDQYGLYVVADANLMPYSEQHRAVATEQEFVPLFQQRVEHLHGRYKNYTSIILWSLGNSKDNGVCMTAAYKWLKALDKTRPVVFSGAGYGEATDIIAPSYPGVKALKQMVSKQGDRPCLMLAAVDPSSFADLDTLWRIVENNHQLQGGFVDVWPLAATMKADLKHLFSPFDVRLSKMMPDEGEFTVSNRYDFSTFAGCALEYNIYTNLQSGISGGELPVAVRPGESEKVRMLIPHIDLQAGEEPFIRFDINVRRSALKSWQTDDDTHLGTVVFPLQQKQQAPKTIVITGSDLRESGNDSNVVPPQLLFLGHEDWSASVVDRFHRQPDPHTRCVDYMLEYTTPDGTTMCQVRCTHTLFATGDQVVDYTVSTNDPATARKLRPLLILPSAGDSITWFGLDRQVALATRNSALVGIYTKSTADTVARKQVRWCATHKDGRGLFAEILGEHIEIWTDRQSLRLYPHTHDHFRLHLHPYNHQHPSSFYGHDFPQTTSGTLQPPTIKASAPRFSQPLSVTISAASKGQIRYTLDGSEPSETSALYDRPLLLTSTTVVKARVFAKDTPPSFTATRKFNYDHIVKTDFSRKPNTPYNVGTDTLLFDGQEGTAEDLMHGWLGFSGGDLQITVRLAKPIDIESLTLRFAHNPSLWAFAPKNLRVSCSVDGDTFVPVCTDTLSIDPEDQDNATPQVVSLRLPLKTAQVAALRISLHTLDRLPSWHKGKGLKPWLMTDEIEIEEQVAGSK